MWPLKSLYSLANSIFSFCKSTCSFFKPYFGFSGTPGLRTLAVFAYVGLAVTSMYSMFQLQACISVFLNALASASSFSYLYPALTAFVYPVLLFALAAPCLSFLSTWLKESIIHEEMSSNTRLWLDSKAFLGVKFLDKNYKKVSPAQVIAEDVSIISRSAINLIKKFLEASVKGLYSAYQLYVLSPVFYRSMMGMLVPIPGYMLLIALVYSVIYIGLSLFLNHRLNAHEKKESSRKNKLKEAILYVDEHAEEIALKKGGDLEKKGMLQRIKKIQSSQYFQRAWGVMNDLINAIHQVQTYIIGLIVSIPAVLKKSITPGETSSTTNHFTNVVQLFGWWGDNSHRIRALHLSLGRLKNFKKMIYDWQKMQAASEIDKKQKGESFKLADLSVFKPNGEILFENISIDIPLGKATVICGRSGIGKSTLFRTLAGLWPYATGSVHFPVPGSDDKIHTYFVPQSPYFPQKASLIECILYPNEESSLPVERDFLCALMKKLSFSEEVIKNIAKRQNWQKILSGGEQQRIALIGAILCKPEILLIDEGTSALDLEIKAALKSLIHNHLKGVTIIAIDHHASNSMASYSPMYDHKILIQEEESHDSPACEKKVSVTLT